MPEQLPDAATLEEWGERLQCADIGTDYPLTDDDGTSGWLEQPDRVRDRYVRLAELMFRAGLRPPGILELRLEALARQLEWNERHGIDLPVEPRHLREIAATEHVTVRCDHERAAREIALASPYTRDGALALIDTIATSERADDYRRGANDEARAAVAGMTDDAREVYDYVQICARQGDAADRITTDVAIVFTATWPLRRRLALAWKVIRP